MKLEYNFFPKKAAVMEITLQAPVKAQLTKPQQTVTLSVQNKTIQENFRKSFNNGELAYANSLSIDFSRLSEDNRLLVEDTRQSKKVTMDSNSLINMNYSNVANDAVYKIDRVEFSKKETEDVQKILKHAVSYLKTPGSNLDYRDYASMGIAFNSLSAWADKYLTEEQSNVIKTAISNYTDLMAASESENQIKMGTLIDESKYYGATVSNDEMDKMINQMEIQLSKITGKTYSPSHGNVITQSSATNRELTFAIMDLFSNIDLKNTDSVQNAYSDYKKMVTPAYNSFGISDQQNGLNNVLGQDISLFTKQISDSNAFLAHIATNGFDITA